MLDGSRFAKKTAGPISIPIPLCQVILSENNLSFEKPEKDFNHQREFSMIDAFFRERAMTHIYFIKRVG